MTHQESSPRRIQRKRTKDPRPGSDRVCYLCRAARAKPGQNGYCSPDCRFWDKVHMGKSNADCWLWLGARSVGGGYGRFDANNTRYVAHRFSYEAMVGMVPEGYQLDHVVCANTICVNPRHVEPVTPQEHGRRSGIESGRVRRAEAYSA